MIVIDGKDAVLGRLAQYAAKEALKGEDVSIVNCEEIMITGSRENILKKFRESRERVGSAQGGPKISRLPEKIVKRAIRGMLPNVRKGGRGSEAFKKIKCHVGVPKEFENSKMIEMQEKKHKFIKVKELGKR